MTDLPQVPVTSMSSVPETSTSSVASNLYDSSSNLGLILAKWNLLVMAIMAIGLVIGGIFAYRQKITYTLKVQGSVTNSPNCSDVYCDELAVAYRVPGESEDRATTLDSVETRVKYTKGSSIVLYVDPDDKQSVSLVKSTSGKTSAIAMWTAAGFFLIIAYFVYWLVNNNKAASAFVGPLFFAKML